MRSLSFVACALWLFACDESSPAPPAPMGNAGAGAAGSAGAAGMSGGVSPGDGGPAVPADTVVVLPDTQFYSCAYPQIFAQQASWVVDQRERFGIALVLHTGDIVDTDDVRQWDAAKAALRMLDGVVPYLAVPGNHDLRSDRSSLMPDYFTPELLMRAEYDWTAQVRDPGRLDNLYAIVEVGGRSWLFIGLEFSPRDAVMGWAAQVLAEHAELPAVLFTHAYLYSDGARYDREHVPHQKYHPDDYQYTPDQGINDGEDIWSKLIEPHENVRLVLSGHVIPDGLAHSTARRKSGTRVHQVLANYQQCDLCPCEKAMGGNGYLRRLAFALDGSAIHVSTYSPFLDQSLTDPENEFVLTLD